MSNDIHLKMDYKTTQLVSKRYYLTTYNEKTSNDIRLRCKIVSDNILFSRTSYLTIKAQNYPKDATIIRLTSSKCKNL